MAQNKASRVKKEKRTDKGSNKVKKTGSRPPKKTANNKKARTVSRAKKTPAGKSKKAKTPAVSDIFEVDRNRTWGPMFDNTQNNNTTKSKRKPAQSKNLKRKTPKNTKKIKDKEIKQSSPIPEDKSIVPKEEHLPQKIESLKYNEEEDVQLTLVEHLDELRKRFVRILIFMGFFTILALAFSEYLVAFLQKPYTNTGHNLITTRPTGAFLTRLKVSLITALIVSLPFILHQVWLFAFPALSKNLKKLGTPLLIFAFILFLGGAAFNYLFVLPIVLDALQSIAWEGVEILYNIDDYYSFITMTTLMFGVIFELPIFVLIFVRVGLLTHQVLIRKWRYSLVIGAVIAAILTPPDAVSLIMMLLPMVILYLVSIAVAFSFRRRDLDKT